MIKEFQGCTVCRSLGTWGICNECKPKLREYWKNTFPLRYRDANLDTYNTQTYSKLKQFSNDFLNQKDERTGLFLYGSVGIGKSHLMYSAFSYIIDKIDIKTAVDPIPLNILVDQEFIFQLQWANTGKGDFSIDTIIQRIVKMSRRVMVVIEDLGQGTARLDIALAAYNLLIDSIYKNKGWLMVVSNYDILEVSDYIGFYAVDRLKQLCGKDNFVEMKGESLRK